MNAHTEIETEIKRLKDAGLGRACVETDLREIAALTSRINKLKREKNAVICAHVYQFPEIIKGIGDFVGDSYKLAADSTKTNAEIIIFCGVNFMGETAKILNPDKRVFVPSLKAGCSLSEGITAEDVVKLKKDYPDVPVVTYINTSAEVKAESDCIVTSSNAERIMRKYYQKHKRVIFIPDKLMGTNLAKTLGKTPGKEIILWDASCIVHDRFNTETLKLYRKKYPGLLALAHAECSPDIAAGVDFLGGTGTMMKYIEATNASAYLLITECGFGELAKMRFPEKNFIAMCRLCPYMKSITLDNVLFVLENLPSEYEVSVPENTAARAKKAIEKMFELAE